MKGCFSFILETQGGLMNMIILKNCLLKSYDLPATHWVGKVNFGKLSGKSISEKFRIFSTSKIQKVNLFLYKSMFVFQK